MSKILSSSNKNISQFFILNSAGEEEEIELDSNKQKSSLDLALNRLIATTVNHDESVHFSRHLDTVQQLKWADYEPASDKGHYRYYPQ